MSAKSEFILKSVWAWLEADKSVELVPWCEDPLKIAEMNSHKETMDVIERFIIEKAKEFDRENVPSDC